MAAAGKNRKSVKWALLIVALLFLVALLVAYGDRLPEILRPQAPGGDCVKVHFIDVGQGSSTLIQSGKEGILIDAGEAIYADRVIGYIRRSGVKTLTLAIATHPHSDHIGALAEVLRAIPTETVVMPRLTPETTPTSISYEHLLEAIRDEKIQLLPAKPGETYELQNGRLTVLAPLEQAADLNDMSVICRLEAFSTTFLLPADAQQPAQNTLLQSGESLRCDVLLSPHHGASNALNEAFLQAAKPQMAVISCGKNNDYGHPHADVLRAYKQQKLKVYRTDKDGTVLVSCYADGYRVDTKQ